MGRSTWGEGVRKWTSNAKTCRVYSDDITDICALYLKVALNFTNFKTFPNQQIQVTFIVFVSFGTFCMLVSLTFIALVYWCTAVRLMLCSSVFVLWKSLKGRSCRFFEYFFCFPSKALISWPVILDNSLYVSAHSHLVIYGIILWILTLFFFFFKRSSGIEFSSAGGFDHFDLQVILFFKFEFFGVSLRFFFHFLLLIVPKALCPSLKRIYILSFLLMLELAVFCFIAF